MIFGGRLGLAHWRKNSRIIKVAKHLEYRCASSANSCVMMMPSILLFSMSGCVGGSEYMGVPLSPRSAPAEVQRLAQQARAGDKIALFELGKAFENGTGLPRDLRKARLLYQLAAESGQTVWLYQPAGNASSTGMVIAAGKGNDMPANPKAAKRLSDMKRHAGPETFVAPAVRPPNDTEIKAGLLQFDSESCRAAVDDCDTIGTPAEELITDCGDVKSDMIICRTKEIKRSRAFRRCKIQLQYRIYQSDVRWTVFRKKNGKNPRQIAVECRHI